MDVNIAKSQLSNMLARRDPGPGYIPPAVRPKRGGRRQLGSGDNRRIDGRVQRRQSNQRGYTINGWHKKSGRANHRLDCLVYALAALSISRLKIDDCEIQRTEARHLGKQEKQSNKQSPFGARKVVGYQADLTTPTILPLQKPHSGFGAIPGSGIR